MDRLIVDLPFSFAKKLVGGYNDFMNKFATWLTKNDKKVLAGMVGLYILIVSTACIWKYQNFLYDGLDLAIYNNALWNTVQGNWFWSSIQGHNYWGDHFEPILILLLPIYYLWQSPLMLLILQTLVLGLAAWPIYLVVKKVYPEEDLAMKNGPVLKPDYVNHNLQVSKRDPSAPPQNSRRGRSGQVAVTAIGLTLLWLINPLVHNVNLYEFHAIVFLPFFFFWLFYIYLKIKTRPSKKLFLYFYILVFLCLMIREDVAFIILTFLIILWLDAWKNKEKLLLRITSYELLVTLLYLILAFKFIGHLSPSGFSPFAFYYGWLWQANWLTAIKHLLTLTNLEMVLGFLAPFFFLPVIKPRWLLISVIPLAQIILSAAGGGAQVWQIHYGALFLPALMIAFIYAWPRANEASARYFKDQRILFLIIVLFNLALWPNFGPVARQNKIADRQTVKTMLEQIEPDASIMASFRLLPNLSSRKEIYSLHYYFLGVQQFAQAEYILDRDPEYILMDKDDYQYFDDILKTSAWAGAYYDRGYQRLGQLLSNYQKMEEAKTISLWQKN